jgi:hypothetical protein
MEALGKAEGGRRKGEREGGRRKAEEGGRQKLTVLRRVEAFSIFHFPFSIVIFIVINCHLLFNRRMLKPLPNDK